MLMEYGRADTVSTAAAESYALHYPRPDLTILMQTQFKLFITEFEKLAVFIGDKGKFLLVIMMMRMLH